MEDVCFPLKHLLPGHCQTQGTGLDEPPLQLVQAFPFVSLRLGASPQNLALYCKTLGKRWGLGRGSARREKAGTCCTRKTASRAHVLDRAPATHQSPLKLDMRCAVLENTGPRHSHAPSPASVTTGCFLLLFCRPRSALLPVW